MYTYMQLIVQSSISYFLFQAEEDKKICLEKGWGRTLDVQKWLQQYSSS